MHGTHYAPDIPAFVCALTSSEQNREANHRHSDLCAETSKQTDTRTNRVISAEIVPPDDKDSDTRIPRTRGPRIVRPHSRIDSPKQQIDTHHPRLVDPFPHSVLRLSHRSFLPSTHPIDRSAMSTAMMTTTAATTTSTTPLPNVPSIPALAPVALLPRRASPCAAPLAFLESIDAVEINHTVERDGVVYFVLDVYLKPVTSRIPTTQLLQKQQHMYQSRSRTTSTTATTSGMTATASTAAMPAATTHHSRKSKPDYQIEKRFSDFADLRYQVWVFAQRQTETHCALSNEFMNFIVHSFAQPRLLVRLATTTNMRKKLLTTFCNEFLRIAVRGASSSNGNSVGSRRYPADSAHVALCEVRQTVPTLLARFFRKQDGAAQ